MLTVESSASEFNAFTKLCSAASYFAASLSQTLKSPKTLFTTSALRGCCYLVKT